MYRQTRMPFCLLKLQVQVDEVQWMRQYLVEPVERRYRPALITSRRQSCRLAPFGNSMLC